MTHQCDLLMLRDQLRQGGEFSYRCVAMPLHTSADNVLEGSREVVIISLSSHLSSSHLSSHHSSSHLSSHLWASQRHCNSRERCDDKLVIALPRSAYQYQKFAFILRSALDLGHNSQLTTDIANKKWKKMPPQVLALATVALSVANAHLQKK